MATILNSDILVSAILHKTLTQTTSMWLKLMHSHSTWWWQPSWALPSWIQSFCTKKTSLIHSDLTWQWQPSWILACWIQTLPSWIQTPCFLLSHSLKNTLTPFWLWLKLIQSDSTKKTHSFSLNLMMAVILNLAILDAAIIVFLSKSLTLAKIGSHYLHKKPSLIHCDSTWWWQPSWTLPWWINTLPSWIQTPCYLLSDSLKITLIPFWLWLKLIQSN